MKTKKKVFVECVDCNTEDYEIDLLKIEVSIELSKDDYNKFSPLLRDGKSNNAELLMMMLIGKKNVNKAMNI